MLQSITLFTLITATVSATPIDFTPPGGWESIKYPAGTGENFASYPSGTGENLPSYPAGTGENLSAYPTVTGSNDCTKSFFGFTSTYHVVGTPDQVVNGTTPTGGLKGSVGNYNYGINGDLDLICWNITLSGFEGDFTSPARTATHIHQAVKGASGPPRLAFPNPTGDGHEKTSYGCMKGPFTTGLVMNGQDTGMGFMVKQIEEDPANFFTDVHSTLAVPGANRGQLA